MKKLTALFLISMSLVSSCELASGIFKAGFWSAIIIVVLVVMLIIYLVTKAGGKK